MQDAALSRCTSCGIQVPEGWPSCPDCGAPASAVGRELDPRLAGAGSDPDMFPLLAAANLHRIRGEYAEAERKCLDILRQFPDQSAPYSLLGQIYEEQDRCEDAVAQYRRALDLDPASETDRSLLARASQRQASPAARPARTLPFSVRPVDLVSDQRMARGAVALLGAVCLSLVIFLGIYLRPRSGTIDSTGRSNGGMIGAVGSTSGSGGHPAASTAGATNTGATTPDGASGGSGGSSTAGASGSATGSASANTRGVDGTPAAALPHEQTLLGTLAGSGTGADPPYSVESVQEDPRMGSGYARVTVALTNPVSAADAHTAALHAAVSLAATAATAGLSFVTIRVTGVFNSGPPTLLFIGEVSPSNVSGTDPASVTPGDAAHVFQNAWWFDSNGSRS